MLARAFYNEINDYAADWLENLISRGLIADGVVDRRSIAEIKPSDLDGFCQVHFFAGLGGWSYALRNAGIRDSVPVWTGSCPCQPFSAAGKGGGFDDERHLWPHFHWLIEQCRPRIVLGEQVASKDGLAWIDLVQTDLEGSGYTSAAIDSCSAGFGAPHIRQRLYWMAYAESADRWSQREVDGEAYGWNGLGWRSDARLLADADAPQRRANATGGDNCDWPDAGWSQGAGDVEGRGGFVGVGHTLGGKQSTVGRIFKVSESESDRRCALGFLEHAISAGPQGHAGDGDHRNQSGRYDAGADRHAPASGDASDELADSHGRHESNVHLQRSGQHGLEPADDVPMREGHPGIGHNGGPALDRPGPTNGFWSACDWIFCRDGKWRPVEPGSFPLAHGLPRSMGTCGAELRRLAALAGLDAKSLARAKEYRIGTLSAYGNAINFEQATEFCRAAFDATAASVLIPPPPY
jgi:DNA (cytosine-5)-methyltransferase 1